MAPNPLRPTSSSSSSASFSHPPSPLPSDPDLQLPVDEDDDEQLSVELDEELVALSTDDEGGGHDHRDGGAGGKGGGRGAGGGVRKKTRFSLMELGRMKKGKYSQVTATVEARPAPTAPPATSKGSSSPSSAATRSSPSLSSSSSSLSSSPSALSSVRACVTLFNCALCVVLCLTIFFAGYIGWTIGHRGYSTYTRTPPRLLVVSMDGFRPSYITDLPSSTPNLRSVMASGLSASRLTPVFPSSTFPNHLSLVTGLYPPSHGIVANTMYNESSEEWFYVGSTANESHWWMGEPIWATAGKWGLSSAVLNWPGSDVAIQGRLPDISAPYNGSIPDNDRVDRLLAWLDADACALCMIYISTVDSVGHAFGPNSTEVTAAVASVDAAIGRLLVGLRARSLLSDVNLLIISDHGMADVASKGSPPTGQPNFLFIEDVYHLTDYLLVEREANAHILPLNDATKDELLRNLSLLPNVTASLSVDLPPSFHYTGNPLIQPIIARADQGFVIIDSRSHVYNRSGAHGYDPSLPDMAAVMVLAGVGVQGKEVVLPEVQTVDVYGVMCALLGIPAAKNQGDLTQFIPYLKH